MEKKVPCMCRMTFGSQPVRRINLASNDGIRRPVALSPFPPRSAKGSERAKRGSRAFFPCGVGSSQEQLSNQAAKQASRRAPRCLDSNIILSYSATLHSAGAAAAPGREKMDLSPDVGISACSHWWRFLLQRGASCICPKTALPQEHGG